MANKSAKSTTAKSKSSSNVNVENYTAITLPTSLPCSEVEFPILITKSRLASWQDILDESEIHFKEIQDFIDNKEKSIPKSVFRDTECDYIKNQVFTILLPAVEETLKKAEIWEALRIQKCFFNGIDHIVQILWNNNPRHPERKLNNLHIFNMPWIRNELTENPRPYYPKSWLWPEEYAATLIQKTVRQYFVQRNDDVQEMREFWRKLVMERDMPDLTTNPFLAKKFAIMRDVKRTNY